MLQILFATLASSVYVIGVGYFMGKESLIKITLSVVILLWIFSNG